MGDAGLGIKIGDKALELADIDMLTFLVEDAVSLALAFVGTDSPTYGGKVAPFIYYRNCISEITLGEFGSPFRNIVAYRASFFALRHFAVQATLRLAYRFGERIALANFFKIIVHYFIIRLRQPEAAA